MTVNNSANKVIAAGNGVQTVFNFAFIAVAASDLEVILTDSSGNETILLSSAYSVALNATPPGQIWSIGGNVTYPLIGSPIPTGSTLTIVRQLSLTQLVALGNQGNEFPSAVETALDLVEMQLQQVFELFQRSIVAPLVDPSAPLPLPPAAQRANHAMGFDASGNPIAMAAPASGMISTAMQPVVDAATLALARTAMGLGTMAQEGIGAGLQDDGSGNARVNSALTSVAVNASIGPSADQLTTVATGPITYTLARANTLWNGFAFTVFVLTGPLTLVPDANDSIQDAPSGSSVIVPANSVARITTDGAASGNWRIQWSPWNVDGPGLIGPVAFGSVRGLSIVNNVSTPNTQVDVAAPDCVMINASGYGIKKALGFTIDLTQGTVTSTANGLDGEAIPANGWLYIWAISNGMSSAGLASTSPTAPTLPVSYTFKKYLGAMRTASSILKRTRQFNNRTAYAIQSSGNTTAPPVAASGSNSAWTAVALGAYVPPTAIEAKLICFVTGSAGNKLVAVAPNPNYPSASSGVLASTPCSFDSGSSTLSALCELLLEGTNIYYAANDATAVVSVYGWTDGSI